MFIFRTLLIFAKIKILKMKKIIILLVIALIVFSCKKANNIQVTISDVPDGRKVFLKKQVERKIINIDSTTVQNGKFGFNVKIEEPVILGIFIDSIGKRNEGIYPLIGVNDKVIITAFKDSLYQSKVTGSKLHTDLTNLREMKINLTKQMSEFTDEFQEAQKENDTAKINAINKKAQAVQSEISLNEWKYIKANPNSHVSAMVLSNLFRDPTYKDSIKIAFDGLSDEVRNAALSKQLKEYLEKLNQAPKMPNIPQLKRDNK